VEFIIALVRPYLVQLAVGAGIAAAAGGGFLTLKLHYTHVGYQQAIDAIAAEDKEAIDAADQARGRVSACRNAGGMWDQTEGQCSR
jgi:hypothetical protein